MLYAGAWEIGTTNNVLLLARLIIGATKKQIEIMLNKQNVYDLL